MPVFITDPLILALVAACSYLLGAAPFGLIITRAMGFGDVRAIGSGNIGATNVLRTGSKAAALATLILDGAKGAVAVLIARALWGEDAA
ncbi:MAG: glycerol-3-phosphate acyltransferase, partial [Cypionkella sp.]